jgi:hypothetical protein
VLLGSCTVENPLLIGEPDGGWGDAGPPGPDIRTRNCGGHGDPCCPADEGEHAQPWCDAPGSWCHDTPSGKFLCV